MGAFVPSIHSPDCSLESQPLLPGYCLCPGSPRDRALLSQFMAQTYQELYPQDNLDHLSLTVDQYLSSQTPLWWVQWWGQHQAISSSESRHPIIGCLWFGNAIDQINGSRHTHLFLLYIAPEHRRRGLGTLLMHHAETWAQKRGDHQISLQVFLENQPALKLYQNLGYQTQSLWMTKSLKH